jgi:hypothetical protein
MKSFPGSTSLSDHVHIRLDECHKDCRKTQRATHDKVARCEKKLTILSALV